MIEALKRREGGSSQLGFGFVRRGLPNMQGADLYRAQLQKADLKWAQLQGAEPMWADFEGADFWAARLDGADLTGAQLRGARFTNVTLRRARLIVEEFLRSFSSLNEVFRAVFRFRRGSGTHATAR